MVLEICHVQSIADEASAMVELERTTGAGDSIHLEWIH
jgi:hypothetical protein